jgi:phosphotransferase system enzyme I (PtsI)
MGLKTATGQINTDDMIIVDGTSGIVIVHPDDATLMEYALKKIDHETQLSRILQYRYVESETLDGIRVGVMGNIEIPEEAHHVIENGGDGIGLYRTEFQYMGRSDFPAETELFESYRDVVLQMAPMPVTIRTLDINGDKALNHSDIPEEQNPALGLRAIRYCMKRPDIFKTQIRAILRAAHFGNVRILLPMISSCEEILEARKMLSIAGEELNRENLSHRSDIEVGIMVEVPSVVILSGMMAKMVDFFSIGTNDLIQFSLAIDRGNRDVAYLYSPLHPAIIRMIQQVIENGRRQGIPTYMCGEMASDPMNIPVLLGLGLNEISMNPQSIPAIKRMIASLRQDSCVELIEKVLLLKTTREIMDLVYSTYGSLLFAAV